MLIEILFPLLALENKLKMVYEKQHTDNSHEKYLTNKTILKDKYKRYTIDTGNPTSAQALTNTATGAKIKAFESNAVM